MSRHWLRIISLVIALMAVSIASGVATAAGLVKKGEVKLTDVYNPKPDGADLMLPMPCGVSMAFRAVGVPVKGYLSDLEVLFGCDDCDRPGLEFYERQYNQGISGPFRLVDLPQQWQQALKESGEAVHLQEKAIYLIGKYEVSNQQWDAVMGGTCPQELGSEAALPKGSVSWFEAVEFSRKYMEWLLQEHKGMLPAFAADDRNVGYLRLPTEREWEYAARGGHKVTTDALRNESLFDRDKSVPDSEYAVFAGEGAGQTMAPQRIGSRRANPLGIHDSAGNLAEMVLDPFMFSAGGRLVGAAGGFVRKGGSFMTGFSEVLPGRREECAYYVSTGESRARDLGFRLVLSAMNVPSSARLEKVKEEWKASGTQAAGPGQTAPQFDAEMQKLLSSANEQQKKLIEELKNSLKDRDIALTRQQENMARLQVQSSLYTVEGIRNLFIRRKPIKNQLAELETKLKEKPQDQAITESIKKHREYIQLFDAAIDANVGHYKILVEESARFHPQLFDKELQFVAAELAKPSQNKAAQWQADNLKKCLAKYQKHLALFREGRMKDLKIDVLRRDMVSQDYW